VQFAGIESFDAGLGAYWHEDGGIDGAPSGVYATEARFGRRVGFPKIEESHCAEM
jgi:hypothetical protein